MEFKQIIVSELPDDCSKCLSIIYCYEEGTQCGILNKLLSFEVDWMEVRADFCPLKIERVCEWYAIHEFTDRFRSEGFWHIGTKCEWVYPEDYDINISELDLDTIGDFIKLMGFAYCPNCGKRIVYKEEE